MQSSFHPFQAEPDLAKNKFNNGVFEPIALDVIRDVGVMAEHSENQLTGAGYSGSAPPMDRCRPGRICEAD